MRRRVSRRGAYREVISKRGISRSKSRSGIVLRRDRNNANSSMPGIVKSSLGTRGTRGERKYLDVDPLESMGPYKEKYKT
jgi:hypothetical protein